VQERDRRWAAVRSGMGEPWNLDAIVAGMPDEGVGNYLVPVFNAWGDGAASGPVVFARSESEPVNLILPDGDLAVAYALEGGLDRWTADGRLVISGGDAVPTVVSRLKELGARRVGLAELTNLRVAPEGATRWKTFEALRAELPNVEFVEIERWKVDPPVPGPIAAAAMVKGPEELQVVRRCVSAGEQAIDAIVRAARAGAKTVADVWHPAYLAMFEETGEPPVRLSIALDDPGNAGYGAPRPVPLREGQIINEEISAGVQGYGAQVNQSIFIGGTRTPGYDYFKTATNAAAQSVLDAISFINENLGDATTGDLIGHVLEKARANGTEQKPSGVWIHTDGKDPLPRPRLGARDIDPTRPPEDRDGDDNIKIVPGMAFDWKPRFAMDPEVIRDVLPKNRAVQVGVNIIVTDRGAERVGTRKLAPLRTRG